MVHAQLSLGVKDEADWFALVEAGIEGFLSPVKAPHVGMAVTCGKKQERYDQFKSSS